MRFSEGGVMVMHARHGCQACGLVKVAIGLLIIISERVVKRVAPMPDATEHNQLSSAYTTAAACEVPYPSP